GIQLGAFDVESADDFILNDKRHRQRAPRPGGALEKKRVRRGIRTKIALAARRHKTGDAVPLRLGVENAAGGIRRHPFLEKRLQAPALPVAETNFDDIIMEEIVCQAANVELEQLDALFNAHLGELIGTQSSQLAAGL